MKNSIRILLFCLLGLNIAQAQEMKTNAGNMFDPRISFISPAALGFGDVTRLVVGYNMYYQGIAGDGLRNGFAAFSLPDGKFGSFGLIGEHFTSNNFQQGDYRFGYSQSFFNNKIRLGLELGVIYLSYNSDKFQGVDLNDPVFQQTTSKSSFNIGSSIFINPVHSLYAGISVRHLNRPNASLIGEDVRIPTKIQKGIFIPTYSP
ncbi:hypothetical protein B6I21_07210 [candidate division KSB1 bacterium 4572_119]|nr:MAG: hypothetical protein B6I21_07210 [candidate division KSB1 bacterium 4572_119]